MSENSKHKHPGGNWYEDEDFKEFSCYGETDGLNSPSGDGYNLIGAGGDLVSDEEPDESPEESEDEIPNEEIVKFYIQDLDTGDDFVMKLTPDSARQFAERLQEWADDAETIDIDVEAAIENVRNSWYEKGGLLQPR